MPALLVSAFPLYGLGRSELWFEIVFKQTRRISVVRLAMGPLRLAGTEPSNESQISAAVQFLASYSG